ncbi:hypothetical protein EBZ39_11500 [bacterium]|nr:hypothetical protein [bacterium]
MHALDRNNYVVGAGGTGALSRSYSHLLVRAAGDPNNAHAPSGETDPQYPQDQFDPTLNLDVLVNNNDNGTLEMQGQQLRNVTVTRNAGVQNVYNSNIFGNKRFRPAYRLNNHGLMVMADVVHDVQRIPVVVAGALGYISGDAYPYNDETSRNFYGFIPQRSRYRGYGVKSFLVFDRLVIPRPLNISYRTLYAYNDLKDLSNLKFLGFGATWFPWEKRSKGHLGLDVMFLAEVAKLYAWDVNGRHPDAAIETQLVRLRNTFAGKGTLFRGWQSSKRTSKYLGYEVDLRAHYELLDHCDAYCRFSLFVPGQLYKDLDGQPNILTRRTDDSGFARYDTLGSSTALGIMLGMQYRF